MAQETNPLAATIQKLFYELRAKEDALRKEGLEFLFDEARGTPTTLARYFHVLRVQVASGTETTAYTKAWATIGIRLVESPHMPEGSIAFLDKGRLVGILNLDEGTLVRIEPQNDFLFQPHAPRFFDPE
jgi:hypothetical protein